MKVLSKFVGCVLAITPLIGSTADFVVVHAGKLMSVPGESVKSKQSIVIRDGKVIDVKSGYISASSLNITKDDTIKIHDLKNKFVLPGLIDGHVHITDELDSKHKMRRVEFSDPDTVLFGANNAKNTLNAGFTTVRDLGARGGDSVFALRDAIAKNYIPGPRIYTAGFVISPTGGHGQRHGYRQEVFEVVNHSGVCDGVADCRRAVRDQVRRGADQIKFVATGGVTSETASGTGQQFFDDEIKAIVDTAHALGRKVAAHAHNADGLNAALRAGADSIEHGTFADKESLKLFKKTGAYLIPTLLAGATVTEIAMSENSYYPPAVKAKAIKVGPMLIENLRKAYAKGIKIAFGTDSGVSKHGLNAREFELLVQAGLTPTEAIKTATVYGADNLGKSDLLGSIEAGKYADLVAVDGDPTKDIKELMDIDFVMKEGIVYKNK
ncbi:amidohydrolase family protein [Colwellia sp. RE-S-Sl-9]